MRGCDLRGSAGGEGFFVVLAADAGHDLRVSGAAVAQAVFVGPAGGVVAALATQLPAGGFAGTGGGGDWGAGLGRDPRLWGGLPLHGGLEPDPGPAADAVPAVVSAFTLMRSEAYG